MLLSFCLLSLFIYFFSSDTVSAAGFTLSSAQTSINAGDEFNVNVNFSISAANGTIYYLRGAFYQTSGNYCGFTWNGSNWYNGPYTANNGWQQLLAATINQSSWSGQLKARIDPSDGNCQVSGNYYFKIQRYTNGGSSSFDDQNSLSLNVTIPTPTLTPTSTPTPAPTNTPMPTPTPSKIPTTTSIKISPSSSIFPSVSSGSSQLLSSSSAVLGITREPTKSVSTAQNSKQQNLLTPFAFGGAGLSIASCGILLFLKSKKEIYDNNIPD